MKRILTLAGCMIMAVNLALSQQIPNSGFEDWTKTGDYEMPDSWDNLNPSTDSTGIYTCTKGSPGSAGSYFVNLTSTWIPDLNAVVPGMTVSGVMNPETRLPLSGFAFVDRPELLTGKWQYMSFGAEHGYIEVLLTRWNSAESKRDTVAYKRHVLSGMVHSWTTFNIPLDYISGSYPDSCIIVLSASGSVPADFDFLWVDALDFSGNVITGSPVVKEKDPEMSIFPNPSGQMFNVSYQTDRNERVQIVISDQRGTQIQKFTQEVIPGSNVIPVSMQFMQPGSYLVSIRTSVGSRTKQIIIR